MGDIILTITMHPDGRVDATGPLNNKVLCYGLLEMAKEVISTFEPGKIQLPIGVNGASAHQGNGS